jgi:hypothetical protein
MAFKKSGGGGKDNGEDHVPEIIDAVDGPASPTALQSEGVATASVNSDVVAPSEAVDITPTPASPADEVLGKNEEEEKLEDENDLSAPQPQTLDEKILAGGGMELDMSDDAELSSPAADNVPSETGAAVENVDAAGHAPTADEVASDGARPRLERVVGNGSALSPNAQRKAAQAEKDAARQGYGGGGGGGIGALVSAPISGLKWALSGVGAGIMHAGGQKLADRFLQSNDPASVAKRTFRFRNGQFAGALKNMDAATEARGARIDQFNKLVSESDSGRILQKLAKVSNTDFHEYMSDVKSGKNSDPIALECMKSLESDPVLGRSAKGIVEAQEAFTAAQKIASTNLDRLAADSFMDINVGGAQNLLVDSVEKAETDMKRPLPLEASLKDVNTGAEEKIDTEKQHKKFMEALDKIKESIAALLQKIMSKLGIGGPK